jgi:hypothetical protein
MHQISADQLESFGYKLLVEATQQVTSSLLLRNFSVEFAVAEPVEATPEYPFLQKALRPCQ